MRRAADFRHWPPALARTLTLPRTNVFHNAQVSAARYPDKPFIIFYDSVLTFAGFLAEAEALAGHLQHVCGVKAGDRVLLYMQNSPQWVLAFYAILRANAVVVPINPMNRTDELRRYIDDTGAAAAFVAQDLLGEMLPLHRKSADRGLRHVVVATYSDHLTSPTDLPVPEFVAAPRDVPEIDGVAAWTDARAAGDAPGPLTAGPDDPCVMPYTSGTTGLPKGCVHTHSSVMSTLIGGVAWFRRTQDTVYLSALPFFHVTGMSSSMNGPVYAGATMVLLARWDREVAARCIERYRIDTWQSITAMMVDFLANPDLAHYDLSSLQVARGGGAAMPAAVALRLKELVGLDYVEGYGMSETMAATHLNPPQRPMPQCLGIPVFDVDARIVDPETLRELPQGESGEIVVHGPQVMQGYWNNPEANAAAFIKIDGKSFLRTGDLAMVDEDGYFFMTDRLKRMINASGYKVWPAEVEALMYRHPAILEACVIAARDAKRGETVKALVVLRPGHAASESEIAQWCREHMAVYKAPRIVAFMPSLPKSGTGKVMWRALQEMEDQAG
ncbi:long-chain fatty acid--CoA ligase [Sphingobium estronivorans]|uniref:long-chain fatty acid--CoA ligase n=1 Tax=Sphingobium estronivorans TaxID=1577690 RepID=UPI00123C566E|nr:long-chain fatty acid--CoA ligase [Sphingobium estronivorans]